MINILRYITYLSTTTRMTIITIAIMIRIIKMINSDHIILCTQQVTDLQI